MSVLELCGAVYDGPTFPAEHGAVCLQHKGHDNGPPHGMARHMGQSKTRPDEPLSWYSQAQKEARAKEKAA